MRLFNVWNLRDANCPHVSLAGMTVSKGEGGKKATWQSVDTGQVKHWYHVCSLSNAFVASIEITEGVNASYI